MRGWWRRTRRLSTTSRAATRRRPGRSGTGRVAYWRTLTTDEGATFDKEVVIDAASITPHVTWGTNPAQVVPISGAVPDPEAMVDAGDREAAARALAYMGLVGGNADARDQRRHRLPGQLHELADRGLPGGCRRAGGAHRPRGPACAGCARVAPGQGAGRGRGPRQGVRGRRASSGASRAAPCAWP